MTALALGYIYTMALIGIIGLPHIVGKEGKGTASGAAITLVTNLIESILVLSLWSNSEFTYKTAVTAFLLIANLCFMIQAIMGIGKKKYYSPGNGVFSLIAILVTVGIASLLAFG